MLVSVVAVAEVKPDRDVRGHAVDTPDDPGEDLVERHARAKPSFEQPELDRDVPLHGAPIVRDPRERLVEIGEL